ncbi:ABC transporter substrate-binding protein [Peloplasma aerotolerans]|uniref:ABC transporter substrate-binding protein n=1 Tax=Peloplasma aerotolerans TaxID=3044389 RepID=A0AAW6U9K7_9MOLU|nr:ABC transporter substrate-binding protein [Mariniplasma sp. M4Ah]MDI6453132.1 ABC transporter substrate-binding protein [Mariniplasma sp. M4Ah]
MKKMLLAVILLIVSIILISCGGRVDDESTISFSWWGTSDRNIATYQAIELFEERYPQYKVEPDQAPWSGYQTTLNNRLNRGTEADVFQVNYNWIYSMYGEDYFMDITELGLDLSHYPPNEHTPLSINGKVLGLSVSETGYIFYLNKNVYDLVDLDINEIKTWDDLMNAGQQISSAFPGRYAIGRLDAQQAAILMFTWLSQKTGKNVISENNTLNFTQAELIDAFNFISDLRSSGVLISSNVTDTHNDGPTNPNWTSQRYGGVVTWNTAISEYQNTLPNQGQSLVAVGMFQQTANENTNYGMYKKVSMAYAVSKRVEESDAKKEAVRTFIEFMTTDPEALEILGVDRGVTNHSLAQDLLRTATSKDFTQTLEWKGHETVQTFYQTQIENDINLYIHPYYEHATFRAIYEQPIENFLLNRITAVQAAQNIINRFDTELAKVIG